MFLSDVDIKEYVAKEALVIEPFVDHCVRENETGKVLSYGLGPAGYDVRLKPLWKVFAMPDVNIAHSNQSRTHISRLQTPEAMATYKGILGNLPLDMPEVLVIDPKNFDEKLFLTEVESEELLLWPGQYALAVTLEYFEVPNDLQGTFFAKSTYARWGLMLNTTNVQPGFKGEVVMEFFNASSSPILLRASEGFAQVKFDVARTPAAADYSKVGKYQHQTGVQAAKV